MILLMRGSLGSGGVGGGGDGMVENLNEVLSKVLIITIKIVYKFMLISCDRI